MCDDTELTLSTYFYYPPDVRVICLMHSAEVGVPYTSVLHVDNGYDRSNRKPRDMYKPVWLPNIFTIREGGNRSSLASALRSRRCLCEVDNSVLFCPSIFRKPYGILQYGNPRDLQYCDLSRYPPFSYIS